MYRVLFTLALLAPLALPAAAINDAYSRYIEAGQFQFLREFFTGKEYQGRRTILRTDPAERSGQYFVLTLDQPIRELPAGTEIVLEVIAEDAIPVEVHRFPLADHAASKNRRVLLGLTSGPWLDLERDPLAWRVRLMQGKTVEAEWKSFLWEMP